MEGVVWLKNNQFDAPGAVSGLAQGVRRVFTEFSTAIVKKATVEKGGE
ncbi:hypothetical protein GLV89_05800 [Halomonas alkaliantarctica]|nr:hypothetical protein [Halomonas alkaliantarctica]